MTSSRKRTFTSALNPAKVRRLVKKGWSNPRIAAHLGFKCPKTIRIFRDKHGIPRTKVSFPELDRDVVKNLVKAGLTDGEIAAKLKCSLYRILSFRHAEGIHRAHKYTVWNGGFVVKDGIDMVGTRWARRNLTEIEITEIYSGSTYGPEENGTGQFVDPTGPARVA